MIKASELRIGNCIERRYTYKGNPGRNHVDTIAVKEISEEWLNRSCGEAYPILLTPAILEQCGFKKDSDSVLKYGNSIYWLNAARPVIQISIGYSPVMNITCKYLHQLQNIIFTLTEKELEINLHPCPTS